MSNLKFSPGFVECKCIVFHQNSKVTHELIYTRGGATQQPELEGIFLANFNPNGEEGRLCPHFFQMAIFPQKCVFFVFHSVSW